MNAIAEIGKGFFGAHHLEAIRSLEESVAVNIAVDFAVLCSNCHLMIYWSADPSNEAALRAIIESNET